VILQYAAKILSAVVTIYMILCFLRIMVSWLPGLDLGRPGEVIARLTDPYLRLFSRMRWLRIGQFDFSPILALALLTILSTVVNGLSVEGYITLGKILALLAQALWSAFGFVLSFFAVCILLRFIVAVARWNSLHPFWMVIDSLLNPVLYRINRLIYRGRIVNYLQSLITGFVGLVLTKLAGDVLVGLLARLLRGLPF
jgi:YggT family protein